jgi:hypothetical protein
MLQSSLDPHEDTGDKGDTENMAKEMMVAASSLLGSGSKESLRVKSVLSNLFQQTKELSTQLAGVIVLRINKWFYE